MSSRAYLGVSRATPHAAPPVGLPTPPEVVIYSVSRVSTRGTHLDVLGAHAHDFARGMHGLRDPVDEHGVDDTAGLLRLDFSETAVAVARGLADCV